MSNKPDIKIIFVDIDWTIFDHDIHDWDYESIDVIKKIQNSGILIFLCTARPYDSILRMGLFDVLKPDGIIATNGAVGLFNDKVVYSNNIPISIVEKTEQIAMKYNLVVEMCHSIERYFTLDKNEWVDQYFLRFDETIPPTKSKYYDDVSGMLLFAPSFLDEELKKELPSELAFCRYDECGVDLCYYQNDKGKGIVKILDYLNLKKENAIGIGDDYSDIAMFNEVGISIALGNGREEVRENATYVSDTIHNHGVGKTLLEIFNIKK